MPGMMDTVLNLGLNDVSVGGLARQTGNDRFAYDSYRRFVQMFGKVVLDVDGDLFEDALHAKREERGVATDPELGADDLRELVESFKAIVKAEAGIEFPQDPDEQLRHAIEAVFKSWNGDRARLYRDHEGIPHDLGTAVNVQSMVFGNKGDDSGTGVAFTRDPATGENVRYGDFLANAQGEDVVAGIRVTEHLDAMGGHFPEGHRRLLDDGLLEKHYRDMCDIEFTIRAEQSFSLQTGWEEHRAVGLRGPRMVEEGLIDAGGRAAVLPDSSTSCSTAVRPEPSTGLAKGLTRALAAVGQVYFTADEAEARHEPARWSSGGRRPPPTTCTD